MPDEYDDTEESEPSPVIRDLRAKAKRTEAAEQEANDLRTELAISRAGLDLTPLQQKALLAAHEGEATPEALHQTAVALGITEATAAPAPEEQVPAEEQAAIQRTQNATAAAEAAEANPQTLNDRILAAKSPEEVTALLESQGLLRID